MDTCMPCMKCATNKDIPVFSFKNIEMNEDGLYEMECINGHKTVIISQNEKFEILFDMGINALKNGYKQEAVACIHASMERFHEWCTKVILTNNGVELEKIEKTWNLVKKQSERQLGAFYFLYLYASKKAPSGFKDDKTAFRNRVIHEGYIPKYEEVFEYCVYVMDYIRSILKQFKIDYSESISTLTNYKLSKLTEKAQNRGISTMCMPTILGLYTGEEVYENTSTEELIKHFSNQLYEGIIPKKK